MHFLYGVFLILLVVTSSIAFESFHGNAKLTDAESPENVAERSFEPQDCQKDTHEGPFACMALIWRYKWSDKTQGCVKSVYGGCNETKNNFKTMEECEEVAAPICRKPMDFKKP